MTVTIKTQGNYTILSCPFYPDLPPRARKLGGKFVTAEKSWRFDARDEERVRVLARDVFGTAGDDAGTTATVRMPLDLQHVQLINVRHGRSAYVMGREICHRPGRDERVQLGRSVVVIEGEFSPSAGSIKNPGIGSSPDMVVELRDIPRGAAERIVTEVPGASIVDDGGESRRLADLRAEREKLIVRLAWLDAELSEQGDT